MKEKPFKSIKAFERWIHKQIELQIRADVKEYFYWREFIQLNQE